MKSLISQMNCHRPYTKNKGNLMKKEKKWFDIQGFWGTFIGMFDIWPITVHARNQVAFLLPLLPEFRV